MPDGANTGNTEQEPGTPAEQVRQEIAATEFRDFWRSVLPFGGEPQPHQSGGGGTGGQFMFASLDELDGVISRWEQELRGILADREQITEARRVIADPAADQMSQWQARVSRESLGELLKHNDAMLRYAENYIAKLLASREQMAVMEDGARDRMRSVRGTEA